MLTAKQEEFIKNDLHRITLLYGSVRSGKTFVSLLKWALVVGESPVNSTHLIVGRSITTIKRNCLSLLEELIGVKNFNYSLSQKQGKLFGRTIYIEGANDIRAESKIRGMTLTTAYVDELTLIGVDFYTMLLSRLSQPKAKLIATTNPDTPNHYVFTDIIQNEEIDRECIKFKLDENTFLDEDYIKNLKKEYTGVYYSRFVNGDWVAAEGLIYEYFVQHESLFYVSKEHLPRFHYIVLGVDWGGNRSKHGLQLTGITYDWKLYALRSKSIVATGTTPDDVFNAIETFANECVKDFGVINRVFADSAEQILINGLRAKIRLPIYNSDKGVITDRIRAANMLMARGDFYIVENENDDLVEAFKQAVWDESKLDDVRLDDGSYNMDILDAWEYSWSYFIQRFTRR